MMRRGSDRRAQPRFEVIGDLWGMLETTVSLGVQNLGRGGALFESPLPLAAESVHVVRTVADGHPYLLQMRVRHSTSTCGEGPPRFLIGVEFVRLTPAVEEAIVRYMGSAEGGVPLEA